MNLYVVTATNEKGERKTILNKKDAMKFKKQTIESLNRMGKQSLLKNPRIKKVGGSFTD